MLTAHHVLEKTPKVIRPLTEGPDYVLLHWVIFVQIGNLKYTLRVTNTQDCGNDIGLLEIDLVAEGGAAEIDMPRPFAVSADHKVLAGMEVWTAGFPNLARFQLSVDDEGLEVTTHSLWLQHRLSRGHITSTYDEPPPFASDLPLPAFELSFPVLPGTSGAPVLLRGGGDAIALITKNFVAQIPARASDGSEGMCEAPAGFAVSIVGFA